MNDLKIQSMDIVKRLKFAERAVVEEKMANTFAQ